MVVLRYKMLGACKAPLLTTSEIEGTVLHEVFSCTPSSGLVCGFSKWPTFPCGRLSELWSLLRVPVIIRPLIFGVPSNTFQNLPHIIVSYHPKPRGSYAPGHLGWWMGLLGLQAMI